MQIRVRIPDDFAKQLAELSPRARARVVSLVMRAQMTGVAAADLVATHRNLQLVGHLLNQSLKASRGTVANREAVESCVNLLKGLTR